MNRLECIGKMSKKPSKDALPVKPGIDTSIGNTKGGEAVSKLGLTKTMPLKSQPSAQSELKSTLGISAGRQTKGNINRNGAHGVLQPPTSADVAVHGKIKMQKTPVGEAEVNNESVGRLEKKCETDLQASPCLGASHCPDSPFTSESGSGEEEEEVREVDEEATAEFRAPIELLAEFLKAVMGKDYTLSKKLCQMILIYEPENAEAKHFLPLIEERLQIEAAQGDPSNEDNTSDDNEEEGLDEDENEDDDEDDDDDDSSSCDSEDESTDSSSSSSDRGD